jgi:hypothetical protein
MTCVHACVRYGDTFVVLPDSRAPIPTCLAVTRYLAHRRRARMCTLYSRLRTTCAHIHDICRNTCSNNAPVSPLSTVSSDAVIVPSMFYTMCTSHRPTHPYFYPLQARATRVHGTMHFCIHNIVCVMFVFVHGADGDVDKHVCQIQDEHGRLLAYTQYEYTHIPYAADRRHR